MSRFSIFRYYLKYKYQKFDRKLDLVKYQEKKLRKHLRFVTDNSGFYSPYSNKSLKDFPIVDKETMMPVFDTWNTVHVNRDEAEKLAIESEKTRDFAPKLGNITVGLSSGTSGNRGLFLISDKEKDKWAGFVLAKFLPGSILGKYKIAFFMRADSNLYENVGTRRIQFKFFDIYKSMHANIIALSGFSPDILVAQPSQLLLIAREILNKKLVLNVKRVISIAEVLESSDAEILKEAFGVSVIHQAYQCTEGMLGVTCKYGTIHLNENLVYIEKDKLDDTRFVPIITDFERTSQPIIRYRLNDILVEKQTPCRCGSKCMALCKVEGRKDDCFVHNGIIIFPDFVRRCVLFAGDISEYRIVQNSETHITVYATLTDEQKQTLSHELNKLFYESWMYIPCVEFKDYSFDNSKKLKRVESEVKK